ncbi:MAG: hypothetical protein IJH48_03985 [Oscillospiraceae bacterium]|nr:hypothetical protein [Oscillospiraceae bacterium]
MKNFRKFLSKPAVTAVLFALALLLLGSSTVGGARAALNIQSEYYNSEVEVYNIGLALIEKNAKDVFVPVAGKNALMGSETPIAKQIEADTKLLPGKTYPEVLAIRNVADINEYVRVSVFKYWLDENGNKFPEMNSDWIELGFVTGNGWHIDESSSTEERTVLYYGNPIAPGEDTTPFLESVRINDVILTKVSQSSSVQNGVTVIRTSFIYNGKQFCIEVIADSVQDHNADQAKLSAWGINNK